MGEIDRGPAGVHGGGGGGRPTLLRGPRWADEHRQYRLLQG